MHWGKEVLKDLLEDVDGEDFFLGPAFFLFLGLAFFLIAVGLFALIGVAAYHDNVKQERLEYKEIMEKQCDVDQNSELCKLASNKYFDVKEKTWTDSPIVWVAATIVVIVLLVLIFW